MAEPPSSDPDDDTLYPQSLVEGVELVRRGGGVLHIDERMQITAGAGEVHFQVTEDALDRPEAAERLGLAPDGDGFWTRTFADEDAAEIAAFVGLVSTETCVPLVGPRPPLVYDG